MQRLRRKEKEKRVLIAGYWVQAFYETRYRIECCRLDVKMVAEPGVWTHGYSPQLLQMQYTLCIYGGTRDTIWHPVTSRFIGGPESTTSYICHTDKHQIKNQT
jgi:hypothetical protein